MNRTLPTSIVAFVLVTAACVRSIATTYALPAKPEWFVGAWHGYSNDGELEFIRLELKKGGGGAMALSELPDYPTDLYRVHWQQLQPGSYALGIRTDGANPTTEPITLGDVRYDGFVLTFQLHGQGYSRHFVLYNEKEFARRSTAARLALKKVK